MLQEISFAKLSPTQNMTILVKSMHSEEEYAPIASRLMSYDNVFAEQVGFIKQATHPGAVAALNMAGGEFCGNACMALAALTAHQQTIHPSESTTIHLEASGTDQLINCLVQKTDEDDFFCKVMMPVPRNIEARTLKHEGNNYTAGLVQYSDFLHIILEVQQFTGSLKKLAENLARMLEITSSYPLIGVLLFKPDSNELLPLMYVPALDSLVWERGCGSGTASVGAYAAWKNRTLFEAPIQQPGGIIRVSASCEEHKISGVSISGNVSIVAEGKAYIHL
ncbi:diaminopimelate epimerase [Paenibacillus sp. MMS20-IR301]|uniref:diaminopimelate epimerase n=1 Tax=Paenibacillus sp. MMS20-IR301 TaxID=2895946 RepID=UPI0028EF8373|nr:diaminopimelate epimerase [Paenibacillus sp. MMS20-IR301]WNS45179.1 diaminopimelate epimerase [Paenibacillus sp. MMS20-IR301]